METINELGKGLYQVALQYKLKPRAKKALEFYAETIANDPIQAYRLALNHLYIITGKDVVIKDNIVTLVIPNDEYLTNPDSL